jgi:hypothetical protein
MKASVLLLVHNHPEEVKRLVDSLKADFDIFIHIDAKSNIPPDMFASEKNVRVIKRYEIRWGSVQMTYATLDLLKMAFEQSCDYYILISGADLPVRPAREIAAEIAENPDLNYVDCAELPRDDFPLNGGLDRLTLFWEPTFRGKKNFYNVLCALFRKFQRLTGLKRKLIPVKYYGGGQWFNFSKEVVKYILDYTAAHPAFLKQFRHTRNADEIYFLTLAMHSGCASKIITDNDKRYIDWESGPEFPRTLRMEDYDRIAASGDFFARKFDPAIDAEIIEKMRRRK